MKYIAQFSEKNLNQSDQVFLDNDRNYPYTHQVDDILLDAARRGKTEVAKALLRNKAEVNYRQGQVPAPT